jgi:2,4-dienoyl-CoA reductase-like NADH-dependent reductase (Old Yellow Enzyme family)
MSMDGVFDITDLCGIRLGNRFIRSATYEALAAEDGSCTQKLTSVIARLAAGQVGLIITGHAFVRPEGQAGPFQLGIFDDSSIEGLRTMSDAVHDKGGRIIIQLSHAGNYASPLLTDERPLVPSYVEGVTKKSSREMTPKDILHVVKSFGEAGLRARKAGFDGVQIHAAHGYLLSQFLSPLFNRRSDEYGGPIENRSRIILEVLKSVKLAAGGDFPVFIKMNCRDFQDGGLDLSDSLSLGRILQEGGIGAIELSGGTFAAGKKGPIRRGIHSENREAYFREEARSFKENLDVPLILVGGIRSYGIAERLIREG